MKTKYIVAGWLLAAAVAMVASIAAVGVARGGLLSHPAQPMTAAEVKDELADAPTQVSPSPAGGDGEGGGADPSPSVQPSGQLDSVPEGGDSGDNEAVFPSDGGTVLARCTDDGMSELVWWVAEQGYSADEGVERGPAPETEVEFEGSGGEFEFTVTCAGGEPQASIEADD